MAKKNSEGVVYPEIRRTKRADGTLRVQRVPDPKRRRTKQAFKDEVNINLIMKKFEATGLLPSMIKQNPFYGDFAEVGTYQESLEVVMLAQEQFAALPAQVRARFQNDPAKFLEFATDPANGQEMVAMGLAEAKPIPGAPKEPPAAEPSKGKKVPEKAAQASDE